MVYVLSLKIMYSSDHPILLEFRQLVVNIVVKKMVFETSAISKSNHKKTWRSLIAIFSVKVWCFDGVFHIAVANAETCILKCRF